jgi:hypothetical protein
MKESTRGGTSKVACASALLALSIGSAACALPQDPPRRDRSPRTVSRIEIDLADRKGDERAAERYQDEDVAPARSRRETTTLPRVRIEGRLVVDADVTEERPAPGLKDEAKTLIPAGRLEIALDEERHKGIGIEVDRIRTDSELFGTRNRLEWTEGYGYGYWVGTALDERIQGKVRVGIVGGAGDSQPGASPNTGFEWAYGGPRVELQPEFLILKGDDWFWSAYARGSAAGLIASIDADAGDSDVTVGRMLLGEAGLRVRAGPTELTCGYLWRDYEFEGTGDEVFGNDTPETRLDIDGIVVTFGLRF